MTEFKAKKGVGYYNIDKRENRDKRDKTLSETDNDFSSSSHDLAAYAALVSDSPLDEAKREGALPQVSLAVGAPTPLDEDQVRSCVFQLFDNGESSPQRYKYKLTVNLIDGTNPEFIASLTKDLRNFKKYVPEPYRQDIIDLAMASRTKIKKKTGNWPYIGKLHLNTGFGDHKKSIQIEPDTLVVIWWDPEERGWSGFFKFQDWIHEFDLFEQHITAKQRAQGVRAQDNWQNPKYDKRVRPKTWAEQRFGK